MRGKLEQGYFDQGYRLPEGLSWERVVALRDRWGVNPLLVPERSAPAPSAGASLMSTGKPDEAPLKSASACAAARCIRVACQLRRSIRQR